MHGKHRKVYIIGSDESIRHAVIASAGVGGNPTGPTTGGRYSTKYYDPVARHERYLRERAALGIGQSRSTSSHAKTYATYSGTTQSNNSSGKGSSGSGGSGKGSSGSGSASKEMSEKLNKLRQESSLNTAAQQEAAKRKIEDIKAKLATQIQQLQEDAYNKNQNETNLAELRGTTQNLRKKIQSLQTASSSDIEKVGTQLQNWISSERTALEKRISALYSSYGQTYTNTSEEDSRRAAEKTEKEIASRADAIYKRQNE